MYLHKHQLTEILKTLSCVLAYFMTYLFWNVQIQNKCCSVIQQPETCSVSIMLIRGVA
jgi:hypothetical protein